MLRKLIARLLSQACLLVFCAAIVMMASRPLLAQEKEADGTIYIKVGTAQAKKSLLGLPPLQFQGTPSANPNFQTVGSELFSVISNDLLVSGFFQFINQGAFLEDSAKTGLRPLPTDANGFKYENWKQIGAEFLVKTGFSIAGQTLTLETYTYHIPKGQLILGKKYRGELNSARRIAHKFTNDLVEALTGKRGMFLSRIVVASDRGNIDYKEIFLLDWDGANVEKVSNHKSVTLSPDWSHDGSKIAYTAFVQRSKSKSRNADMFIYDLNTKKRLLVSYRQGINSGANFSPDKNHLFLTISQNGNPDIYKMDMEGSIASKLTNGPRGAMNVEPAVSPDGTKVAFSSDRSGVPMIYMMNADGSNQKRVTFSGKYNSTPAWSPDGTRIAFSGWDEDHYDIFTMDADGNNILRITSAKKKNGKWAQNETPVYSPDGRFLMYTSDRTGSNQIYISNVEGTEERRITSDSANYFKPKWSINFE